MIHLELDIWKNRIIELTGEMAMHIKPKARLMLSQMEETGEGLTMNSSYLKRDP